MGAMIIKGILAQLKENRISLKALKGMSPVLRDMAKRTFQRARDMAIGDGTWMVKGRSMVKA
jgi:hypothetical protein